MSCVVNPFIDLHVHKEYKECNKDVNAGENRMHLQPHYTTIISNINVKIYPRLNSYEPSS